MKEKSEISPCTDQIAHQEQGDHPTHQVRLPGFITDAEIGLGDVIKRTTSYLGIQPCGGCGRRAEALNRWMVFTKRGS